MTLLFSRPGSLKDVATHFCPGCHHGTIHRLVAEALDTLELRPRTIGCASVGCSVFLYDYFNIDVVESPHGRAPAVATGVKRARPDRIVFTYQGDGDLAAIGTAEIIHAANRGEALTVLFINNTTYGMTGGQMAPTTLPGQRTATSPSGRDVATDGAPLKMTELLAQLEGVAYAARIAVDSPQHVQAARRVIRTAFRCQAEEQRFAFVEVLAACPTNWGLTPLAANLRVGEEMIPCFPLGVVKDVTAGRDSGQ